ncbi:MAG TPA: hypothetical protein VF255_01690 [Solirubrobacterales bacterium]
MTHKRRANSGISTSGRGKGISAGIQNPVAWTPGRDLDAREWIAVGHRIGTVGRCIQWVIGDWLAYGNARFGERYARASKITGYDRQTLMNMVYVASRFEISRRREKLSWSHHEALASLPPIRQDYWLDLVLENRWSVADLRTMLRRFRLSDGEREEVKVIPPEDAVEPVSGAVLCPRCHTEVPVTPDLLMSMGSSTRGTAG